MHDAYQRRFPFDHQLDAQQLRIVFADTDGELTISGHAGTGKTAAALYRAAQLCRLATARNGSPVLFLCFNKALAAAVRTWAGSFPGNIKGRIEVRNIDRWCRGQLHDQRPFVKHKARIELVYQALREVQRFQSGRQLFSGDPYFLLAEIELLKGCGYTQPEHYLAHKAAAGSPLSADHVRDIWAVGAAYDTLLWNSGRMDFDDAANFVLQQRERQRSPKQYDHVIVDEAQDLSASQIELVRSLARRSLTMIADEQQAIYTRRQAPGAPALHSEQHVVLEQNYRSTAPIIELSRRLLPVQHAQPLPFAAGVMPVYRRFRYVEDEAACIVEQIEALLRAGVPSGEIAVLSNLHEVGIPIKNACAAAGLELAIVENGKIISPGIRITTMFQAKGCEWEAVFVAGLTEGVLPRVRPEWDSAAQQREIALGRRLLGVALSRARRFVFLSSAEGRPSRYVYELGLEPALEQVA